MHPKSPHRLERFDRLYRQLWNTYADAHDEFTDDDGFTLMDRVFEQLGVDLLDMSAEVRQLAGAFTFFGSTELLLDQAELRNRVLLQLNDEALIELNRQLLRKPMWAYGLLEAPQGRKITSLVGPNQGDWEAIERAYWLGPTPGHELYDVAGWRVVFNGIPVLTFVTHLPVGTCDHLSAPLCASVAQHAWVAHEGRILSAALSQSASTSP